MKIKGLVHVHSNYSDGELSLKEIKKEAQRLGMSFVFLADHLPWIKRGRGLEEFQKECELLSDEKFLIVPGFEVETKEGYHILVYNGKVFVEDGIPVQRLFEIFSVKEEVFLVLAHASQVEQRPSQEFLERIDAVEVWNAKYGSRYGPDIKSLKWLGGINSIAFAGSDAHSLFGLGKLWLNVEVKRLETKELIDSFKQNQFEVSNGLLSINLKKPLSFSLRFYFKLANLIYVPIRNFFVSLVRRGFKPSRFLKKIFHKFY